MATKKDNLPLDIDKENVGAINYANEVISIIAGVAASEVEGIANMVTGGSLSDLLGRNRNVTKGVRVEVGTEEVSVDIFVVVEYGTPIQKAAHEVQQNVKKSIETMTGLHVLKVDVHVQGLSFEKENEEADQSLQKLDESTSNKKDTDYKNEKPAEVQWEVDDSWQDKADGTAEDNTDFDNSDNTLK